MVGVPRKARTDESVRPLVIHLLVPTLCVGSHVGDALRRGCSVPGTRSVRACGPTQSVGPRSSMIQDELLGVYQRPEQVVVRRVAVLAGRGPVVLEALLLVGLRVARQRGQEQLRHDLVVGLLAAEQLG